MTKSFRVTALMLLAGALTATSAFAQTDAQKAFRAIKNMAGTWESKGASGRTVPVDFKVTAGGSAVMSEILGEGPEDMITMFHLDGPNRLLMTHYCGAGNQPRMQASVSPDAKTITHRGVWAPTAQAGPPARSAHVTFLALVSLAVGHDGLT